MSAKGETILVTGGSGSIGSALVKALLERDSGMVVVFSRDETKQFIMKKRSANERLETVVGDVRDVRSVERAVERYRPKLIYHAAAMKHLSMCELFPVEAVSTNVMGTQNIVDVSRRYAVAKLVNISTDKTVYPSTVLGSTKLIGERIIASASYTSVRFGNVAGTRGSVIPVLVDEMLRHKSLTITDSRVTRFILTIDDAVNLILKATDLTVGGEIFMLRMKAFKLSDLVKVLREEIGPAKGLKPEEIVVREIGLLKGEKLHEELTTTEEAAQLSELPEMYVWANDGKSTRQTAAQFYGRSSDNVDYLSISELSTLVRSLIDPKSDLNVI